MNDLTFKFRTAEEAARCDLTRLGNVAAASADGLTVRIEDVNLTEWAPGLSRNVVIDQTLGTIRAAMAACGVWAEVAP